MTGSTTPHVEPPRTRLANFSVSGFLSLDRVVLAPGPRAVLIGANGAGKSNIVSVFELLTAALRGTLQQFVFVRFGGAR